MSAQSAEYSGGAAPNSDGMSAKLRRVADNASRLSEWVVLFVLLVLSVPPILIRRDSLTIIPGFNFLDGSWFLDTAYKASAGIWFGRDVAFTYGPIGQWLFSAPARWTGMSVGTIYATWYTLPLLLIVLATFVTARLLLPELVPWRRALLVLLAVVFWSPPDLRISLCLLAFAIFLRLTDAAVARPNGMVGRAAMAAAICVAGFWLSADTGLYFSMALLICIAATAVTKPRPRPVFLLAAILVAGILVLLTNAAMASLLDFRFWRSSLAIATGYRWFEPFAMDKPDKRVLLEAVALGIVVFALAWRRQKPAGNLSRRPVFLLSGFCVALLITQTAIVRSDYGHVRMGVYPMIFLCGVIAFATYKSRLGSVILPGVAVVATFAFATPYPAYRPDEILRWMRETAHPVSACPAGMVQLDRACLLPKDAQLIEQVSGYLEATAPADAPIAIFPYETAFGFTSHHQVAGGVLQSYLVNGEYLAGLELAGLERSRPPFALYLPDGIISHGVDAVPNFTRSPEVWFYLLQHYHADTTSPAGTVGLLRDDSRRISFSEQRIAGGLGPIALHRRSTPIELAPVRWPDAGADFLRLRLRINYPFWWRLRKPSRLTLKLTFAGGTVKQVVFVMAPNQTDNIWIYPWNDEQMGNYFLADESGWRQDPRPAITGITLLVTPFDWLSVVPRSVEVESVTAVRLNP